MLTFQRPLTVSLSYLRIGEPCPDGGPAVAAPVPAAAAGHAAPAVARHGADVVLGVVVGRIGVPHPQDLQSS